MKILNMGERFIIKTDNGEGLEYEVTDKIVTPFQLIKTLSKEEVDKCG